VANVTGRTFYGVERKRQRLRVELRDSDAGWAADGETAIRPRLGEAIG
jgi:hypothetical protein